eukprot:Em0001g1513a
MPSLHNYVTYGLMCCEEDIPEKSDPTLEEEQSGVHKSQLFEQFSDVMWSSPKITMKTEQLLQDQASQTSTISATSDGGSPLTDESPTTPESSISPFLPGLKHCLYLSQMFILNGTVYHKVINVSGWADSQALQDLVPITLYGPK